MTIVLDHGYDPKYFEPMSRSPIESMAISEFKATCLAVLERVRSTGVPLLITRRGIPVAEIIPPPLPASDPEWFGSMRGTATITGDVVSPVAGAKEWEALKE